MNRIEYKENSHFKDIAFSQVYHNSNNDKIYCRNEKGIEICLTDLQEIIDNFRKYPNDAVLGEKIRKIIYKNLKNYG